MIATTEAETEATAEPERFAIGGPAPLPGP